MKLKSLLFVALVFMLKGVCAQEKLTLEEVKDTFNLYASEINASAKISAEDAATALCVKYYVPKSQRKKLYQIVKRREINKKIYDYVYPTSSRKRSYAKLHFDTLFQDSIDAILIPYNDISGENISYALKCKKAISLDSVQYRYMLDKAIGMAKKIRKNRKVNVWNEEMDVLKKTLTEKQIRTFFILKNAKKVTQKVRDTWSKLKDADLTNNLDSVSDCARAYMYYHEQQKIMDIHKYYGTPRKKNLAELDKRMPLIIKMYNALEKKKRAAESQKVVEKDFVW